MTLTVLNQAWKPPHEGARKGLEMRAKYRVHVVSHTHWDREWYLTFQQLRVRLVGMVDMLLDILDKGPAFRHFTLDGQMVLLEDYLDIRPRNRERLRRYIREGRIIVGPWYVLNDEFLVSGEATVRNLLFGFRLMREFGKGMSIGYLPDQFGHISQMPQILSGFGIDSVVLWRGIGQSPTETGSEFLWEGADGTSVLAVRLPPRIGYLNAYDLGSLKPGEAVKRTRALMKELIPHATTRNVLLMNGTDHRLPQCEVPRIIRYVNSRLKGIRLVHSTLPSFIEEVKKAEPHLRRVRGEFREGRYMGVHPGTLSIRTYLKQENEKTQSELEKWAEPFSALSWILGEQYPASFLRQAWKYLLQNHPHDSICGCSVDEVHREMMTRFASAQEIAEEVTTRALHQIATRVDTSFLEGEEKALIVFNPLGWGRTGLVEATVTFPLGRRVKDFILRDESGNAVAYHVLEKEKDAFHLNPAKHLSYERMSRLRLLFLAEHVPAFGYRFYRITPASRVERSARGKGLAAGRDTMENEYLRVKIERNGSLTGTEKETRRTFSGLNVFEDGGDIGDVYNYSYPPVDRVITSERAKARISVEVNTPYYARYKVELRLLLPEAISPGRDMRSKRLIQVPVVVYYGLFAGSRRIDIRTEIDNRAKDHRLRALFPSQVKTDFCYADGQFDVIRRTIKLPGSRAWFEVPSATQPLVSFVDVSDGEAGLALTTKGIPEYEVKDEKKRTIALTLLRCADAITRGGLLTTKRNQKEPAWCALPEAQSPGRQGFSYAILPHIGDWEKARVHRQSHEHNVPLRAVETDRHRGELPDMLSFMKVEPESLLVSALKKSEKRDRVIVRLYNITPEATEGRIEFWKRIRAAYELNLNEDVQTRLRIENGILAVQVGGKQIVTVEVRF